MKGRFLNALVLIISIILALSLNISCDIFPPLDPELRARKEAWNTIIEAHIAKQLWFYDFFRIYSDNYSRGQLFIYEPSKAQLDYLLKEYDNLMRYADAVQAAADSLQSTEYAAFSKVTANTGIISSLVGFFVDGSAVKENNRKRLLLIASNMSKAERDQLYEELVINKWKREIGSADDFWTKLENGELDDKASTLYKNFYDGANMYLNPFTQLANDKNLTPGKMLAKDGINLCEKGMDVIVESGKMIVPGLEKATELLEKGKDFYEKVEKMVDKPMDAVADEIKSRVAGKFSDMIDIDARLDPEGAGKYVKMVAEVTLGSDDTQELIEKGINAGIARITSPDNSITPDIVTAKNPFPKAGLPDYIFSVGNYVRRANTFIMTLPSGDWDIIAHKNTGEISSPAMTTIIAQQENNIIVSSQDQGLETGILDSLLYELHGKEWQKVNFIHILLYTPTNSVNIMTYNNSLTWSGKYFSLSEQTMYDSSFAYNFYREAETSVSGYLTMLGFDEIGLNLTATQTRRTSSVSDGYIMHMYTEEIQIRDLPFVENLWGNYKFEISPNINHAYLSNIESIVTFSQRRVFYDHYTNPGEVTSDTTFTEFEDITKSHIRVYFARYVKF